MRKPQSLWLRDFKRYLDSRLKRDVIWLARQYVKGMALAFKDVDSFLWVPHPEAVQGRLGPMPKQWDALKGVARSQALLSHAKRVVAATPGYVRKALLAFPSKTQRKVELQRHRFGEVVKFIGDEMVERCACGLQRQRLVDFDKPGRGRKKVTVKTRYRYGDSGTFELQSPGECTR